MDAVYVQGFRWSSGLIIKALSTTCNCAQAASKPESTDRYCGWLCVPGLSAIILDDQAWWIQKLAEQDIAFPNLM